MVANEHGAGHRVAGERTGNRQRCRFWSGGQGGAAHRHWYGLSARVEYTMARLDPGSRSSPVRPAAVRASNAPDQLAKGPQ